MAQVPGRVVNGLGDLEAQRFQGLAGIDAARRVALGAVHEDLDAVLHQQQRGQQKPRQLPFLAGVGLPVQVDLRRALGLFDLLFLDYADETGGLARVLGPDPQHRQERA